MREKDEKYINPLTDFGFKKLFEVAEIASFTEEERKEYEESLKIYRDIKNVVDTARAEGKIEEKEGVIARCIDQNISPEVIAKIVNLDITIVNQIIDKIKNKRQ